jgi:tetratricopeptide (TPR) repeat protein
MGSRIYFYLVISLMLVVSGYVVFRLFFNGGSESRVSQSIQPKGDKQQKPSSTMRFSNSVTSGSGSVWTDPRLKDVNAVGGELKTSAEIENNLKNLTSLYDQGADAEFLQRLKDLIAQNPNVKEYAALLGDYYYNEGSWAEAETAIKRLIELDPQNNFAKTAFGEVLAIQGRYEDGRHNDELVLASDPRNVDAMYGLIAIADMQGKPELGLKAVEEHYRKDPSNGNAAAVYAEGLFARGNLTEGYNIGSEALKLDPANPLLLMTTAKMAALNGNFPRAAELAETAADRAPDSNQQIQALHLAWQAHLEQKNIPSAVKALRRILVLDPNDPVAKRRMDTLSAQEKGG